MYTTFVKTIVKFGMLISTLLMLVCIGVGVLVLLFPYQVWTAVTYAIGAGLLLFGLAIAGSFIYAWIKLRRE